MSPSALYRTSTIGTSCLEAAGVSPRLLYQAELQSLLAQLPAAQRR